MNCLDKMIAVIEEGTLTAYHCGQYAHEVYGPDFPFNGGDLTLTTILDGYNNDVNAAIRFTKAFFPTCHISTSLDLYANVCSAGVNLITYDNGITRQDGNLGRAIVLATLYTLRETRNGCPF